MLTQERLQQVLYYKEATGDFIWKSPISARCVIGNKAGNLNTMGYIVIGIDGKSYYAHRLVWLYFYGTFPDKQLDHIDNNRANNKLNNLRVSTQQENIYNSSINSLNTSGIKGLSLAIHRKKYRWHAYVAKENKRVSKYFGIYTYGTLEKAKEAAIIWLKAKRLELHGSFANDG